MDQKGEALAQPRSEEARSQARTDSLTSADLIPDQVLLSEDTDAFDYSAMALRVADLVSIASAPLNVALFGPWGSGKSSFAELLRRALHERKEKIRLVRYDAWKYGGASLQRNFITHAARELGLDEDDPKNREFFRGLYEKRRTAEVDPTRIRESWRTLVEWSLGIVLLLSAVFLIALCLIAAFSRRHFSELFADHYAGFFTSTAIVAVVITMAKLLLEGLRVDIEQSAPADEEFSVTFGRLVKRALKRDTRIVFFIDELDRCSPEDVVRTLADVKNFLDQPNCVFIIAADREVLEQALTALPQSVPVDEDAPYYSSASAFLDKVFQHEVTLPPLRARRLTRFARDLVLEQADVRGLWRELRESSDTKLIDKVIYALIPSHVRSPRRIKVLLNRFATNTRIAQSRGIKWLARAEEIAKLTVLQTEFPLLANDLPLEPHLPTMLLDPPQTPSPRLERLLERHRIPTDAESSDGAQSLPNGTEGEIAEVHPQTAATATDPLLVEHERERNALASVQRLQLRRYLQRAASATISDPGRDLLYLEAAGAAVGLDDNELGDLIEDASPDAPADVLRALEAKTHADKQAAARLLADMSHQLFGTEQANVVTTMLGVAEQLGDDVAPAADEVVAALRSFLEEQDLNENQLVGAVVVARLVEAGNSDQPLTNRLFQDDRLLSDATRVKAIARLSDRLPQTRTEEVRKAIAELLDADATVLTELISELSEVAMLVLLEDPVRTAITARVKNLTEAGETAADEFVDELTEAASKRSDESPRVRAGVLWPLLASGTPAGYRAAREGADSVMALEEQRASSYGLVGLQQSPPWDWSLWAAHLSASPTAWDVQVGRAAKAAASVIQQFPTADESQQEDAASAVRALGPYLQMKSDEDPWTLIEPALSVVSATQWWVSPEARKEQQRLHGVANSLRVISAAANGAVEDLLLADLQRALPYSGPGAQVLAGLREMGAVLALPSVEQLANGVWGIPAVGDPQYDAERTLTLLVLAKTAKATGGKISEPPFAVDPNTVVAAAVSGATAGGDAVVTWLELDPSGHDVSTMPALLANHASQRVIDAFGEWAGRVSSKERTEFILEVLEDPGPSAAAWIASIGAYPYEEERAVGAVTEKVHGASRAEDRLRYVRLLVPLRVGESGAERQIADLVIWLLDRNTEVDFNVAVDTMQALGPDHRSAGRLEKAFRAAADQGRRIPARNESDFRRANVKLPRKVFKKKGRGIGRFRLP